jgi:hypothetical protein
VTARTRTTVLIGLGLGLTTAGIAGCSTATRDGDREVAPAPAVVTHPEIRDELADLFRRDQRARKDMIRAINAAPAPPEGEPYHPTAMPAVRAVVAIDNEAADYLETVLNEHGWPTTAMVGPEGANAAWLIAQHADRRPALQKRALALMTDAAAAGQAPTDKLAYLTDRVLVADGQPQRYATQFGADAEGVQRPYAWEPMGPGETSIDVRRARVGLPPLAYSTAEWGRSLGAKVNVEPLGSPTVD